MKLTVLFAGIILAALFLAGCQDEPAGPSATADATFTDAQAIRMMDEEIALTSHPEWAKGNRNFIGILSGREEVPPTDSRGRGVAKFKVSKDGMSIDYKLIVANIKNVSGAHVHLGPEGENGPVVFGLYSAAPGGGKTCGPIAEGTFTPADLVGPYAGSTDFSLFLSDLHADSLYVNVHTSDGVDSTNGGRGDYNGGEIRGQLKGHRPHGHDDKDKGPKNQAEGHGNNGHGNNGNGNGRRGG
jgi:hypothetical protein